MITHSVFFTLNSKLTAAQADDFIAQAKALAAIETVKNFKVLKEISPKNNFQFGLCMQFAAQADYDFYNNHPQHVAFVEQVWLPNVAEFLEIDHQNLD